jgi:AraC-like DNA-binding protein
LPACTGERPVNECLRPRERDEAVVDALREARRARPDRLPWPKGALFATVTFRMGLDRTRVVRAETPSARWELASGLSAQMFAPFVRRAVGYSEWTSGPIVRREYPSCSVVVVFELGPPIRVAERDDGRSMAPFPGGFVAGLDDAAGLTKHDGAHCGMRIDLTPLGARRLFGVPMSELAGRIVALPDLLPREHLNLLDRLRDLPSWDARFELLERVLAQPLAASDTQRHAVGWAAECIEASAGSVDIGGLVRKLGYSHKHTLRLFREHVGMTPKLFARLVRFDRVRQAICSGGTPNLAEVAARLGYSDQAHLVREVRHFSGATPSGLRADINLVPEELG